MCHWRMELEEPLWSTICYVYEVRGRYYCLFDRGFGSLHKVMEYEDQWCLGLFLLELKRHKEKLLDENIKTISNHQYQTIMTFFSSISPHAATQSRCHTSGVLIRILQRGYNRSSITMCNAHGPWPSG